MSTEDEDVERIPFDPIFLCFKQHKVMISNAIKKLFPFLEVLRDNNLITEKMYRDFKDSSTNLVPVQNVVYKALEELEKKFDLNVLPVLFSPENLSEYPNLKSISKDFENVLPQNKLCSEEIDRRDPNSQLSLEQGPADRCSQESLTWSPSGPSSNGWRSNNGRNTTIMQGNQTENHQFSISQIHNDVSLPENGLSEDLCEIVHVKEDTTGEDIDGLQRPQAATPQGPGSEPEESCELEVQPSDRDARLEPHIPLPCSKENIKKKNSSFFLDGEQQTQARTNYYQTPRVKVLSSGDSDDGNSCSEESTSVTCQSKPVDSRKPCTSRKKHRRRDTSDTESSSTRKRQRRTVRHTSDTESSSTKKRQRKTRYTTYAENNSISGKHGRKIRKKRDKIGKYVIRNIKMPIPTIWKKAYTGRRINCSSQRGRKRGPRDPRQSNVDFNCPELPVTCGSAQGTLHVKKFKRGIYEKSIQSDNKEWFTPREFEIRGKRERSKKWRQSIRCDGWTLGELIKKGFLPSPLRNKRKCTVCSHGRNLYPCDSCGKFYHENCHIPPVEDKSGPWSCVFCKIKDQAKCQENKTCHKESEVLKRKMLPEEQLKCELLLLTVYCEPKCCFFIPKPKKSKEDFPDLQKHMWLDKIKNRLNKKAYHSVQHFVADMRLIFQNHSILYKVRASALLSFFSEVSHFSSCQVDAIIPLIMGQAHISQS